MKRSLTALVVAFTLGLVGCGGGDGNKVEVPKNPEKAPAAAPTQSGDAGGGANVAPMPPPVSP